MTSDSSPPGWYTDPTGQSDGRYWNGTAWTQMSTRGGQMVNLPIDPSMAQLQPVPGTQVQAPTPPAPDTTSSSGGSGGVIIAVVVGILLLVAVFVAVDDTNDSSTPEGTVPAEQAPAGTQAPAPEE